MKSGATIDAVFYLVIGLIFLAALVSVLLNIPKISAGIPEFFNNLFPWIFQPNDFEKAILCSYYRCKNGCNNLPADVEDYKWFLDGREVRCKDFCDTDALSFFDLDNDEKICGVESIAYPVEFQFPEKKIYSFGVANLKSTFKCIIKAGKGKTESPPHSPYVVLPSSIVVEKEDEDCGDRGVLSYKIGEPDNGYEYFISSSQDSVSVKEVDDLSSGHQKRVGFFLLKDSSKKTIELLRGVDSENKWMSAYKLKWPEIDKEIWIKTWLEEYKCGDKFKVKIKVGNQKTSKTFEVTFSCIDPYERKYQCKEKCNIFFSGFALKNIRCENCKETVEYTHPKFCQISQPVKAEIYPCNCEERSQDECEKDGCCSWNSATSQCEPKTALVSA